MKIHISANDIKQCGTNDARRAQEQLPLLIWKLILASCTLIRNHHFPFYEGIQYNGFDGYLDADSSSPFVPNGKSIWEFGTNQGCKQKFESDYAKRVKQIEPSEQSEYTFCFVTSQIWNARQSAAEVAVEKEKDSHWKNIQQAVNHFPGIIRQLLSANQFLFRQFALGHKDTFFQSYLGMVT